jgi:uncharacterized membrane protein HdeD (DUF308 family)
MIQLILLLLGADHLRKRWRTLQVLGLFWAVAGIFIMIDALDGILYFPITLFAALLLLDGLSTLAVAWTRIGGQRSLRYAKGIAFVFAALLILLGNDQGNFILSMIFGTLFLIDGLLQAISSWVVRYPRWHAAFAGGLVEIALAIVFYQPYPTHYTGTVPYSVGLGLLFSGWSMLLLAYRIRRSPAAVLFDVVQPSQTATRWTDHNPMIDAGASLVWDHPPGESEQALTVHVWTPVGSVKNPGNRRILVDRYIAAVDADGVISTGHAALESPEGIYISLYPATEIDRSPDDFGRMLRATRDNDMPGIYQPNYQVESTAWCASTRQVRIRNYSPKRLARFWEACRQDLTYNLTSRNCSSTVSRALEAAVEGSLGHFRGDDRGWTPIARLLITPELWIAAQIRKRANTMAWTPGLTLDYARALSMLVDPRPFGWVKMARLALRKMQRLRKAR